jgi:phosphoglycerate dehydrogenase-like enzyme
MNLIAFDPYANPSLAASANVEIVDSLDELLEQADFLTLHTPLIASTKGMIGDTELAKMKKTARILNVARGGMIDETALLSALEAGTIAGAGIDVFTAEPPIQDDAASKLIAHPKVVATPHLGASTAEAQENVSVDVCTQVLSILSGQLPRSAGEITTASKKCLQPGTNDTLSQRPCHPSRRVPHSFAFHLAPRKDGIPLHPTLRPTTKQHRSSPPELRRHLRRRPSLG